MAGSRGGPILASAGLVAYGIQTEKSDYRIHVSPITRRVYVFQTEAGRKAIATGKHHKRLAYTGSQATGEGYLVPPREIEGCKAIVIPEDQLPLLTGAASGNTSVRGDAAARVAYEMLQRGLVPIILEAKEITETQMQLDGVDITVSATCKIQVKYDEKAGPREWGGTGNLFLQVAEINPRGMH